MLTNPKFYILTGGPGSGKTTTINELNSLGYQIVPEVGRTIIKEQITINGKGLPWEDKELYANLMLQNAVRDYISLYDCKKISFFDRGIPDVLGYIQLINASQIDLYTDCSKEFRYNKTVFIFPPWFEIYSNDSERKQDFQEAIETYNVMKQVYQLLEYTIIEVPRASIANRVDFLLNEIGK